NDKLILLFGCNIPLPPLDADTVDVESAFAPSGHFGHGDTDAGFERPGSLTLGRFEHFLEDFVGGDADAGLEPAGEAAESGVFAGSGVLFFAGCVGNLTLEPPGLALEPAGVSFGPKLGLDGAEAGKVDSADFDEPVAASAGGVGVDGGAVGVVGA